MKYARKLVDVTEGWASGSGVGRAELTLALHGFDSPYDKIVWDVGTRRTS